MRPRGVFYDWQLIIENNRHIASMNPFDTVSNYTGSSSASTPTPFSRIGERPPTIAEQISRLAHPDPFLSVEDLPRITVKGKQYV